MFFFRLLSYLPLSVLYLFSDLIYLIARYLLSYRKNVIDENLKFAFPEKSAEERKQIRNQFYRNFTDAFFAETIKMLTISEKELRQRFQVVNQEIIDAEVLKGKSALMMAGHVFNWEMAILGVALNTKVTAETVYLKLNNPFFNQLMLKIRTHFGGVMTEKRDFRKSMITMRSQPRIVHLAADQRPPSSEKRYQRDLLNRSAYFFEGGEFMAKKMELPVFFGTMTKLKRGHYRFEFAKVAEPPYDSHKAHSITDEFCRRLEENIRNQPDLYLWSHKRWKM
ncbi:lysophospholipid acyltransferase family protein [Algoriphagus sp.]|uniref:lysophospholipid acyltransferase family protein n=1 Tax=Algoriphagus sp. TaxID=1872435 RepID=UPI002721E845|nr:lysophospholipid acyltransferase family protein [Algoriphagus sp.]MDO8965404.1 lysophospholipid acyltransferase family protein [Algoriphagus sp.]MDP3201443.1 lysophospholipid acyltransferase family protein [Algoriphagus sp.]